MSRSLRRGGTAAIVLALAAVSLSACSAGSSAETAQIKPDTPATSLGADLKLNAIVVVVGANQVSGQPGPANLSVNISNTGSSPETLTGVTVAGTSATFDDASGTPLPGGIVVPAGGAVAVGGNGQATAQFSSLTVTAGSFTPASFSFSSAGKVDTTALVTPAVGTYASAGPSAPVSASPSAGGSASASASAAASASTGASTAASTAASPSAPAGAPASGAAAGAPSGSPAAGATGTPSPSPSH
ncbi:DUF461 domain-containing protein [Kitasatospora sp. NBC_01287]|uniref:DUF461 domain-containing protein n=1 Tax=Kitasatospora sp. NBC_01287 TaxID=2903573 RepID=UPI0022502E37|nr:DUF461 domain-containing protein [Kitasatospora sp. NBC_01287]MCX4748235.1 DUF461 domain-containing protein [Kitasatospora sp. NBC_01287]